MHLVHYLICVATQHELAKTDHVQEWNRFRFKLKKKKPSKSFSITYVDETELLQGVVDAIADRPTCLKKLKAAEVVILAYLLTAKLTNEVLIEGHEIIDKVSCDPEMIVAYLNSLETLRKQGWIQVIEKPGMAVIAQPPFCWLQAFLELGDTFHKSLGAPQISSAFTSNDAYLDAVYTYLQILMRDDAGAYQTNDPDSDLDKVQLPDWFRRIGMREEVTTTLPPAAEARSKYGLSIFQFLTLCGLLGMRDGDLSYEFSDPGRVVRLFTLGRINRKRMKDHIFGDKSPLLHHSLIEGTHSTFGETIRITQTGAMAMLGETGFKCCSKELKARVKRNTLFDLEEPVLDAASLLVSPQLMEMIQALIHSESENGKSIRKIWQTAWSATWGAPTGSTVLLYGPPGTGKTLTAQYLASVLKLPLLKVDAARILSCWVGESEQNVRRIFDDYSTLEKELGYSPVLLLNEADQLLGTRGAGTSATDRMNNNMQNLFLEGLERFSGILVATTNRRDLLDDAFSRRFMYKLELQPPDRNTRIELWKQHLPQGRLSADIDLEALADLGLTGGEIRLVIERVIRLQIFRGSTALDQQALLDTAQEELKNRSKRNGSMHQIGFRAPHHKE
jgi:hypothetical protein